MIFEMNEHNLRLEMSETHYSGHRCHYQYKLTVNGEVIFEGTDFSSGTPDTESDLISLLSFLSLQDGDADDDFFKDYGPKQWAFSESDAAEEIRMLCYDYEAYRSIESDDPDYKCVMESVERFKASLVA